MSQFKKIDDTKISFLALGDWGWQGLNQTLVADAMSSWSSNNNGKFVIALGDNFYQDGVKSVTDYQWENTFIKIYHHESLINIPWYAILGNHDYHSVPQAEIDYYYLHKNSLKPEENRWYMPDHNYTVIYEFDSATLQIVFIDTPILAVKETEETDKNGKWEVSIEMKRNHLNFIEKTLKSSNATWLVVAGHYTVFSNAEHGDTQDLIDCLVPLLEKYNVNFYINGHDHSLQHLSWHGVEYFTSGRGCETIETDKHGQIISDYPWGALGDTSNANEANHFFSLSTGFAAATATKDTLQLSFIDHSGNTLYNTILSNPRNTPDSIYEATGLRQINNTKNYSTETLYIVGTVSVIMGVIIGVLLHLTMQQIRNKVINRRNQPVSFFAGVDLTVPDKKVKPEDKTKNPVISKYEMVPREAAADEEDQAMINSDV